MDPISIELSRGDAGDERVPIVIGPMGLGIERNDARRPVVVDIVEQTKLYNFAVLREHAEVDAAAIGRGA
jgi:hypothetical protein